MEAGQQQAGDLGSIFISEASDRIPIAKTNLIAKVVLVFGATALVIFFTGFFFEKGSLAAGKK